MKSHFKHNHHSGQFWCKLGERVCVFNSRGYGTLKVDFVQVYNQLSGLWNMNKIEYITLAYYTVEMGISLKTKVFPFSTWKFCDTKKKPSTSKVLIFNALKQKLKDIID